MQIKQKQGKEGEKQGGIKGLREGRREGKGAEGRKQVLHAEGESCHIIQLDLHSTARQCQGLQQHG